MAVCDGYGRRARHPVMTERPVIFSAPMVRALLAGSKTMTRRLLKPQPEPFTLPDGNLAEVAAIEIYGEPCPRIALGRVLTRQKVRFAVGDRLWVREGWRTTDGMDNLSPTEICKKCLDAGYLGPWAPILYVADNASINWESEGRARGEAGRLRASMHMPRWASRLTLAVTAVKVERLQDISEDDAVAEGVDAISLADVPHQASWNRRQDFSRLWDLIHGTGAWEINPWVVAITFETAAYEPRQATGPP